MLGFYDRHLDYDPCTASINAPNIIKNGGDLMKRWMRYFLVLTISIMFVSNFPIANARSAPNTKLIVKGNTITEHLSTVTDRGQTLIPLRIVSEALDAQVKWDVKTSTAIVLKWGERLSFKPGAKKAQLQGSVNQDEIIVLEAPAQLKSGTVYVPMRVIAQTLGYQVNWRQGEIRINSPLSEKNKQVLYSGSLGEARREIIQLNKSVHYMNPPLNVTIQDENYDSTYIFPEGEALAYYYIYGDTISWIELKDDFWVCTWQTHLQDTSSGHIEAFLEMNTKNSKGKYYKINKNLLYYSQGIFGDSSHSEYGKIDKNGTYTNLAYKRLVSGEVTDLEGTMAFVLPSEVRIDSRE